VRKGTLRGGNVFGLARPRLLRRRLQGAAIREGELPRQIAEFVHCIEMRRRLFVGLATGEERDAGHRAGHTGLQELHCLLGNFFD